MQVLNFIIKNILTQASVVVGLIALLGLVLQKKPIGTVVSGTMKTILGFLVLSAGSSVIQGSLAIFGDLFNKAFSWWVNDDRVCIDSIFLVFSWKYFFCFSYEEFCIIKAIHLSI